VGQPELRERLQRRAYRALTQRIGAEFHLTPLSAGDAVAYVRHRLKVAGATREVLSDAAIRRLHAAAGGIPRVLNHLATQALLEGLARGADVVNEDVAAAAVADRELAAASAAATSDASEAYAVTPEQPVTLVLPGINHGDRAETPSKERLYDGPARPW
jgi:general secretion pathway protein A